MSIYDHSIDKPKLDKEFFDRLARDVVRHNESIFRPANQRFEDSMYYAGPPIPKSEELPQLILPEWPEARSLSDLVTAKQIGMIRSLARGMGVDADDFLTELSSFRVDMLSKKAASNYIQFLLEIKAKKIVETANTGLMNLPFKKARVHIDMPIKIQPPKVEETPTRKIDLD